MAEAKHSPGPWHVCKSRSPDCTKGHVLDVNDEDVCSYAGENAALIASAPSLAAQLAEADKTIEELRDLVQLHEECDVAQMAQLAEAVEILRAMRKIHDYSSRPGVAADAFLARVDVAKGGP